MYKQYSNNDNIVHLYFLTVDKRHSLLKIMFSKCYPRRINV